MPRLIDKDALISAMEEFEKALGEDMTHGIFYANIAPTVDAVPVIRCKDCKHHIDEEPGMVYCPNIVGGWIEEECYCSWAERKEE